MHLRCETVKQLLAGNKDKAAWKGPKALAQKPLRSSWPISKTPCSQGFRICSWAGCRNASTCCMTREKCIPLYISNDSIRGPWILPNCQPSFFDPLLLVHKILPGPELQPRKHTSMLLERKKRVGARNGVGQVHTCTDCPGEATIQKTLALSTLLARLDRN